MPLLTELSIRDMLWYWALRFSSFGVRAGIAPFRSGMSIAPGSNTHRPSSTRSGMGCGAGRLPSARQPIFRLEDTCRSYGANGVPEARLL